MAGNKLLEIVQLATKPNLSELTDLLRGEVVSLAPLTINVDNRFTISDPFLLLSVMVQEVSWWRGLEVGDKVLMLRINQGQLFYVLEREEGITV